MWFYVAPVLFILIILYVAYPFLMDVAREETKEKKLTRREKAVRRKDDVVTTLKDIEMDYHMGKLSDEDYQHLRVRFEKEAMDAFERVDRLSEKQDSDKRS